MKKELKNYLKIDEMLELLRIIEQQNFDNKYTLYSIESNVEKIKEQLDKFEKQLNEIQDYKPKHAKSDEDAVMNIFNDIINDLENAHVTIIKKDN